MAKVKKSYKDLLSLVQVLNVMLSNPENTKDNTKGAKKLEKIGNKIKPHLDNYNERLEEIRLDNANTDSNGSLLFDEKGGYKYSKEGIKNLNKKIKDLLNDEFEFYQLTFSKEGIENYVFLEGWVEGLEFPDVEKVDEEIIEMDEAEVIEMNAE